MELDVEQFADLHPAMDAESLVKHARAALGHHGPSPRQVSFQAAGKNSQGTIAFGKPDTKTAATFQRPDIVEYGAIVVAGLVLHGSGGLQLTRATLRGSRVDYFVGTEEDSQQAILEVRNGRR